jgi:hypothetical protein
MSLSPTCPEGCVGDFVLLRVQLGKDALVKGAKDILAVLGLLLVGWVLLAMCEASGLVHLAAGGH